MRLETLCVRECKDNNLSKCSFTRCKTHTKAVSKEGCHFHLTWLITACKKFITEISYTVTLTNANILSSSIISSIRYQTNIANEKPMAASFWRFSVTCFAFAWKTYAIAKLNLNCEQKNLELGNKSQNHPAAELKLLGLPLQSRILCLDRLSKHCKLFSEAWYLRQRSLLCESKLFALHWLPSFWAFAWASKWLITWQLMNALCMVCVKHSHDK